MAGSPPVAGSPPPLESLTRNYDRAQLKKNPRDETARTTFPHCYLSAVFSGIFSGLRLSPPSL